MSSRKSVIDFTNYITERTDKFTGREWVFQAVNDWLADPNGSRFFLLTGEPGSGKTAIACRLSQFSQGTAASPEGLIHLTTHFLSAIHFCSARDSRWINPHIFTESLAVQLMKHDSAYAKALIEKGENQHIHIEVLQHIEQGQGIGIIINSLNVRGADPEEIFNRMIREPLEALYHNEHEHQVIILVDALDEALGYSGYMNIISLLAHVGGLPPAVRFILTSRPDPRVENAFLDAEALVLSAAEYSQRHRDDIRRHVQNRLNDDKELAGKVVGLEPMRRAELVEIVTHKAEGNFLYVRFLLDAMAKGLRSMMAVEGLPEGLDALYLDSLNRVIKLGNRDWFSEYAPLLGVLSVAQESLTLAQLQAFAMQSEMSIWQSLGDLEQLLEEVGPLDGETEPEARYRLYHQSVSDFLRRRSFVLNRKLFRRNPFYLPAAEWHRHVANVCEQHGLSVIWENIRHNPVEQGRREYARQYYIPHLYQAQEWQRLFAVLDEGTYGRMKLYHDSSTYSYARDLDLGKQAASREELTLEEGIELLPHLWRYSLLRSSLADQVDQYPLVVFRLLVSLNREAEALNFAELLTDPAHKAEALIEIARQVGEQTDRRQESLQIVLKTCEIVASIAIKEKARIFPTLVKELIKMEQWERAEAVIHTMESVDTKREAKIQSSEKLHLKDDSLQELGLALAKAGEWKWAEALIRSMENALCRVRALCDLSEVQVQKGCREQAAAIWTEAEEVIGTMEKDYERLWALYELGMALADVIEWEQAAKVISMIKYSPRKALLLAHLGVVLAEEAYKCEQAKAIWAEIQIEAQRVISTIESRFWRNEPLGELSKAFTRWGDWEQAEVAVYAIEYPITHRSVGDKAAADLVVALARAGEWKRVERMIQTLGWRCWSADGWCELEKALVQSGQKERAEVLWVETEKLIRNMDIYPFSEQELLKLSMALAQAQRWEQARAVIRTVSEAFELRNEKIEALAHLGIALATAGEYEQAETIWAEIRGMFSRRASEDQWMPSEKSRKRDAVLLKLCMVLARTQAWEQTEMVIHAIEDNYARRGALCELAVELARGQQWKEAKAVIDTVEKGIERVQLLNQLGMILVQAGKKEEAEMIWAESESISREIMASSKEVRAWCELGTTLVQVAQKERAVAIWTEAEEVISTMKYRQWALYELSMALIKAGEWKRAEAVIGTIISDETGLEERRFEHLISLGAALASIGQKKEAEAIWAGVEESVQRYGTAVRRAWLQCSLATSLAQAQQWERAEAVIRTISLYRVRAEARCNLCIALAQAQQWERAEAVIHMIERSHEKARAWCGLATALAQAQHQALAESAWTKAEAAIETIESPDKWVKSLRELSSALAKIGQWERAERLIDKIPQSGESNTVEEVEEIEQGSDAADRVVTYVVWSRERAEALCELAETLAMASEYERLLYLVKRLWIQAEASDYAIGLLPMATGFVPLKPNLGTAFCEAFTWVDTFLTGVE